MGTDPEDSASHDENEPHEFAFRHGALQVASEDFQFFRPPQIIRGSEIISHNEAATPDVLAEVRHILVIELHEARLRQIEEGIFKNVRAGECHDPVRLGSNAHSRHFVQHPEKELFGEGIIVVPGRLFPVHPVLALARLDSGEYKFGVLWRRIRSRRAGEQREKPHHRYKLFHFPSQGTRDSVGAVYDRPRSLNCELWAVTDRPYSDHIRFITTMLMSSAGSAKLRTSALILSKICRARWCFNSLTFCSNRSGKYCSFPRACSKSPSV